ncbi:MAG: NAD(P)H-hydrate dehydratase [Bacteroidetes bacterium]|nr:NAD(P)H-hydrate dehydratase [Bacteroidota bacterium]
MKILPVPLIREADAYTIVHEPISDIDLMERAAGACFGWLKDHISADQKIMVFCGSGNNGGDGLAIGRMLVASGFRVAVYMLSGPEKMSESCRVNFQRIQEYANQGTGEPGNEGLTECRILEDSRDFPVIGATDVIIDALFGSGLARPVEGIAASVIYHINSGSAMVVAIDVPSGLFCDVTSHATPGHLVVCADYTLTFSPPKLAFFFPENDPFVGNWQLLDIGIHPDFIGSAKVQNFMPGAVDIAPLLKIRNKYAHKGTFGHVLLVAGSTGKMGAAVLSARACLRSGPGLVTIRIPKSGISILQTSVPEAMLAIDPHEDLFTEAPDITAYSAIAIGPGIGTATQTASALKIMIQHAKIPILFDADAINILAENKTWLGFISKGSVFTPHPKEFERLVGRSSNNFEQNRLQRDFSFRYQCYVVLKGAHTAITTPDGQCYFNTTGNPGMATGGSGDVLTGIIAGLMAQGYTPLASCLLGVYVHGLAGDIALSDQGFEALIAGDIITNLGKSFQSLYGKL